MIDSKLITFITLGKTKNFTKAAEILNLTQPAVSQHIKALEGYYEVNLIQKYGKQMKLTEEGELLYKYAVEIESKSKIIKSVLKNKSSIIKKYNMGATLTIGGYVLPEILGNYKKIHENVDIILQVYNTELILEKFIKGELDIAMVEGPFDKNKINHTKFKEDELVLAVSPNHNFANRKEVTIDEVLNGNLILREKGSGTRQIFENKLLQQGYCLSKENIHMEIGDINAIISLIEADLGYSIISKEALKIQIQLKRIIAVPIKEFKILREFNFIYNKDSSKEFIESFINFCVK